MGCRLTGLLLAAVLATSPEAQKARLGVGPTLHLLLIGGMTAVMGVVSMMCPDRADRADALADRDVLADAASTGPGLESTDSHWAMVVDRARHFLEGRSEIPSMLTMGPGPFLVGAMPCRRGLFLRQGARLRRKVIAFGALVGLPLDILGPTVRAAYAGGMTRYGTSAMVAWDVLGLVAAFCPRRRRTGAIGIGLSWVGRTAMTCYVPQNLICSTIVYGFGFGLAARMPEQRTVWGPSSSARGSR